MAYDAKVLEIMIASPGDVSEERKIVREIITEWNVVHSRDRQIVCMPIGWETHSAPELSGRPQQIINDRVLAHADILVGIFWSRLGSSTGKAASGTVEEIEEHLSAGKPVMLYFSNTPVEMDSVEPDQWNKLKEFKSWARSKGLVETYNNREAFRDLFRRQLAQTLLNFFGEQEHDLVEVFERALEIRVSQTALDLLKEAVLDKNGMVTYRSPLSGEAIYTNGRKLNEDTSRSRAQWISARDELLERGLLRYVNNNVSKVTDAGYKYIENEI